MKSSIKFLAIIALFLSFNFAANAQRGSKNIDPEKMAEKQTTQMVEKLSLDEGQTAKVEVLNLTYAKKLKVALDENKGNRGAMKEIGAAINAEKNAELKQVLTEAQFKTYEELQAKKKKGKRGRRSK